VLVDQHAAHERVLYNRLLERLRCRGMSQPLLILRLSTSSGTHRRAADHRADLANLGLEYESSDHAACGSQQCRSRCRRAARPQPSRKPLGRWRNRGDAPWKRLPRRSRVTRSAFRDVLDHLGTAAPARGPRGHRESVTCAWAPRGSSLNARAHAALRRTTEPAADSGRAKRPPTRLAAFGAGARHLVARLYLRFLRWIPG